MMLLPFRNRYPVFLVLFALLTVSGCVKAPYTERSQFIIVSEPDEMKLGYATFDKIKAESTLAAGPELDTIKRVGKRIASAAEKSEYSWEFVLIKDDKTVNAFALPGGKVAFYTGILPLTRDESGIAVVMGHEVAHALARHGAERLSQQEVLAVGQAALMVAIAGRSPAAQDALLNAYGVGTSVGLLLPYSRTQESEADKIGLILMAKAGYDPRAALEFWKRMEGHSKGKTPPGLLATHPSDEKRIKDIETFLPVAMDIYRQAEEKGAGRLP